LASSNWGRKIIAPVLITAFMALAVIGQAIALLFATEYLSLWVSVPAVIASLIILGVMIYVLVERIRDIKSGEEDDLDNY